MAYFNYDDDDEPELENFVYLPLEDLRRTEYPRAEGPRFDRSIEDHMALVAYFLERVGFPMADYLEDLKADPTYPPAVTGSSDPKKAREFLTDAWDYMYNLEPREASYCLLEYLKLEQIPTPRWWLEQRGCIPVDEEREPVSNDYWIEQCPGIDENELPPWEVSQTAA